MNKKTHTTAVVLIPPRELWPPIQAIRQAYDRHTLRWVMPHITLLYPFRPREEFTMLAERFSLHCEQIEPFSIQLSEFRVFPQRQGSYTLWLAPEPQAALVRLQALLESVVPDCSDVRRYPSGFTPHLTVGQVEGHATMVAVRTALQALWQTVTFTVAELSLIWRGEPPNDVFHTIRTVKVGK